MLIRAAKWQLSFYTNFVVYKIKIFGTLFKHYLNENEALHTRNSYMKMNFSISSYDMRQIATF